MSGIGVLREGPLHAALKQALALPGDEVEVPVGRFQIDIVRAGGELVEIQTGAFAPLAPKLDALLDLHPFRIVYPVPERRRIVRVDSAGEVLSARCSPRRGSALEIFDRLVAFPSVLGHPNLVLEVLLLHEDHVRGPAPVQVRRRTRDPGERRLVEISRRIELRGTADALALLGELPPAPFSTRELAARLGTSRVLTARIVYCLRLLGLLSPCGRRARAPLYEPTRAARKNFPVAVP